MTQEIYYNGLLKIVSMYREQKEVTRELIKQGTVVTTIMNSIYYYLVDLKEIDPIDSYSRIGRALYILEII